MRSPIKIEIIDTSSSKNIDVCVAPPHEFLIEKRSQLLPEWQTNVSNIILVLQESSISLKESTLQVAGSKKILRAKFLRFACTLIFALEDRGAISDLFDPRTGYPLFASPNLAFDDNAAVKALLDYPVVNYKQCSLITHPVWKHNVYPGTIATVANIDLIESCLQQIITQQNWQIKSQTTLNNLR